MLDKHPPIALETAEPVSPHDDPDCRYVALPASMVTFVPPPVPDWRVNPEGKALLERLAASLAGDQAVGVIDLSEQDEETGDFIGQILGEGEISILADQPGKRLTICEAVFTGVWRVKLYANGQLAQDSLETGASPSILREWLAALPLSAHLPSVFPDDLMNAPALIYELFAKSEAFSPGSEAVINLSLLPLTPEDLRFLTECLGLAGLSIVSKGYGDCRIRRTGLPHVWWVQYFNASDKLILNTLEITALPIAVMAAPEDLEDSASRLAQVLLANGLY